MVKNKKQYTVISIFAGCGGSSLGYKNAGFKELLAIDFNKNAVETFKLNFPEIPIWEKDITKISGKEILNYCKIKKGELDILDGSPPCQGFSISGKRQILDNRNNLFYEQIRLIKDLQPKIFIIENVSGLIKGKIKGIYFNIIQELKKLNYNFKVKLMNTKYYQVPQSRERLIFIGIRKNLKLNPIYPIPNKKTIKLKDLLFNITDNDIIIQNYINWNAKPYCYLINKKDGTNLGKYFNKFFSYMILNKFKVIPTITKMMAEPKPKMFIRYKNKLIPLPEELIKIAGSFPLNFNFNIYNNPIKNYRNLVSRIGNSVPPLLIYNIAKTLKKNILNKL